jgi:hypothetical protein
MKTLTRKDVQSLTGRKVKRGFCFFELQEADNGQSIELVNIKNGASGGFYRGDQLLDLKNGRFPGIILL